MWRDAVSIEFPAERTSFVLKDVEGLFVSPMRSGKSFMITGRDLNLLMRCLGLDVLRLDAEIEREYLGETKDGKPRWHTESVSEFEMPIYAGDCDENTVWRIQAETLPSGVAFRIWWQDSGLPDRQFDDEAEYHGRYCVVWKVDAP